MSHTLHNEERALNLTGSLRYKVLYNEKKMFLLQQKLRDRLLMSVAVHVAVHATVLVAVHVAVRVVIC